MKSVEVEDLRDLRAVFRVDFDQAAAVVADVQIAVARIIHKSLRLVVEWWWSG